MPNPSMMNAPPQPHQPYRGSSYAPGEYNNVTPLPSPGYPGYSGGYYPPYDYYGQYGQPGAYNYPPGPPPPVSTFLQFLHFFPFFSHILEASNVICFLNLPFYPTLFTFLHFSIYSFIFIHFSFILIH